MVIPKTIKVGAHKFKIIQKDFEEDDNLFGLTNFDDNTIQIRKSLSQGQKEATLIHEVIHCINWCMNSEREVELLAQSFYQFLKDNKLLK